MKHTKHTALTAPAIGEYHRNEWAFLGAPCGNIKNLVNFISDSLSKKWSIAYADADHKSSELAEKDTDFLNKGGSLLYTDKITHHRLDARLPLNKYSLRPWYYEADALFINGNHFPGNKQVVIIDPKKEDSLKKRLHRLTNISLILLREGVQEIFPFVKEKLGESTPPVLSFSDKEGIADFFDKQLHLDLPPLHGLALLGGKSLRMGIDKGIISYQQKPQREVLFELLSGLCKTTYLSCRAEQAAELATIGTPLPDTFTGLGPMGAILSAFRQNPNTAWLVVAVDLPLLDKSTLQLLIENRNPSKLATAFNSPVNEFPEPLIAIWEPRAYPVLLQFLAQGYSCPRKALINTDVELLDAPNPEALFNVNTPEERKKLLGK